MAMSDDIEYRKNLLLNNETARYLGSNLNKKTLLSGNREPRIRDKLSVGKGIYCQSNGGARGFNWRRRLFIGRFGYQPCHTFCNQLYVCAHRWLLAAGISEASRGAPINTTQFGDDLM
jgi:hypothetical protein